MLLKVEQFLKVFKLSWFSLILLLFFITEAYFKLMLFSTDETTTLLQITKGITIGCMGLYILKKQPKSLVSITVLFLMFIIGQVALVRGVYKESIVAFFKLIYPIVLLQFFFIYKLSSNQKKKLFQVFEFIILFNSLIILVGFGFDIDVLNSYEGSRFGFNGLFITSAVSSYVYCIALIYLLAKYQNTFFKRLTNLIIILSMFFIGTKVSYFFLLCFFTIYFLKYTAINKKIVITVLLTLGVFCLYMFFFKYGIFNEIRQKDGLISALMSYRNQLLVERTIPYVKEHWTFVNYLFGGVTNIVTKSQIEIIDVFYFFGIFGGFLYLYVFIKAFLIFKPNIYIAILLFALLFIVFLAGNFFSYPSIAIYLVILREFFKQHEQDQYT